MSVYYFFSKLIIIYFFLSFLSLMVNISSYYPYEQKLFGFLIFKSINGPENKKFENHCAK